MSDFNKNFLMGRLVRNVETKTTENGLFLANFSIASNMDKRNPDGNWSEIVNYFDLTIYGNRAKSLSPYLVKGQLVAIDGHLMQRRWEKDGKKQSRIDIVVDNIKLISRPLNSQVQSTSEGSKNILQPLDASAFSNLSDEMPNQEELNSGDIF